ncbi:hypothetical protein BS78_05G289700 [Paspalum vaginatum]|nr:hypothetical protein BS78_05G289700 [Paspalum vaginatum]
MTTTPEELLLKGLTEQSPPSPSIIDEFSAKPDGASEGSHHVPSSMMLPYLSRVLMEDDIDGRLSDHPALLQVQQPFAQIISSNSFGLSNGDREGGKDLLQVGNSDETTLSFSSSKGADALGVLFKGMQQASMVLPRDNIFRRDELVNQMGRESSNRSVLNKRYIRDDNLEVEAPEDICDHEILDDMMLRGHETCIKDMERLRIAMANEVEKNRRKGGRKAVSNVAVAANDHVTAGELLKQIKQHASETGDVTQRLAQCFVKGLEARLVGMGSQLWQLLKAESLSTTEFLKAQKLYMAACCLNKVVFNFSTMTIVQALVGKRRLHILDYGMSYGFQWAALLRLLASREGGPPEVKITAVARQRLRSCPAKQIEDTGCRLSMCAHEFGVPFSFHAVRKKWEEVCIEDLETDAEEVLVVNDHFNLNTLMDESIFFDGPNPKDTVLRNIRKMRPDVFIQSILNNSYGSSYLSRFREALFYYTAIFDMFDATIPRETRSRVVLEQELFGRSALNVIACEGKDLVERPEKYQQWQARNQRAGLRQLPLEPTIVEVLKDEVRGCQHKDFFVCQDGQWLLQGWMGRILFAQSTWVAENASSE